MAVFALVQAVNHVYLQGGGSYSSMQLFLIRKCIVCIGCPSSKYLWWSYVYQLPDLYAYGGKPKSVLPHLACCTDGSFYRKMRSSNF